MPTSPLSSSVPAKNSQKVRALTREQIRQINEFLRAIGEYGEIQLIVQRGELRYINKLESHKVWCDEALKGPATGL